MLTRTSPSRGAGSATVVGFHDPATGSCQYLVIDPATRAAALIDVVLDFDPVSCRMSTRSAEYALALVRENDADLKVVIDTHPHADHLSAGAWLRDQTGAPLWTGEKVREVCALWQDIYNLPEPFDPDADFDRLLADGEMFSLGDIPVRVMLSAGHTLASISLVTADAAFIHDTLMQPSVGTSRADFPGASADALYDSLTAILALPAETRLFIGHDYPQSGEAEWESTVAGQRTANVHIGAGRTRADYVALRQARDATLPLPRLMLHALQFNLRGGRLVPDAAGNSYFKLPADRF